MSALSGVIRLEQRRALRDRAMLLMLAVFALLAGYAALSGANWGKARSAAVAQVLAEADKIMADRRETFVKTVAKGEKPDFGLIYATALPYRAGLPNAPLAGLSTGQAEGYPAAANISAFAEPYAIFDAHRAGLENPAVLGAGRFDLAFVIIFLLPLLLIAATYDFWSRDVESGSARLQLAQPVRPGSLILTRATTRGGIPLVAATAIATLLLAVTGGSDPAGLMLFALLTLAYGSFWIVLVALINLSVRSSTTAALACGTAWLALVVLLPAALASAADLAAPPPSTMAYANAVRAAGLEVRAKYLDASRAAAKAKSDRAYPPSLWHMRRESAERDATLKPLHEAHGAAWARNRGWAEAARFLSPAILLQDGLDRLAGTDATRALAFQDQARAFAGKVREDAISWMEADRLMTLADYDSEPASFAFTEPSRGAALAVDLTALLLLLMLVLVIAALRLRRSIADLI